MRRPWPTGGAVAPKTNKTTKHSKHRAIPCKLHAAQFTDHCKERNANFSTVQTGVGTPVRLRTYKWSSEDLDLPFHSRPSHCVYNVVLSAKHFSSFSNWRKTEGSQHFLSPNKGGPQLCFQHFLSPT